MSLLFSKDGFSHKRKSFKIYPNRISHFIYVLNAKGNWILCIQEKMNVCLSHVESVTTNNHQAYWSSTSCHTTITDLPDPISPPIFIIHQSREAFKAISCIGTELLYIDSSWLSCFCSSMWRGPLEYIAYEFVLTSPAVSRMSGSSNFDSFCDGW